MTPAASGGVTPQPRRTGPHRSSHAAWAPTGALVGVTAVWGSTFVVVADAIRDMPVMPFLAWRFGLATVALVALRPRAVLALDRRDVVRAVLLGLALGLGYVLQTVGLFTVAPTVSGFLTALFVVFTPLVWWATSRRPVPSRAWVAVGVAAAGTAIMSVEGFGLGFGEILTIGAALAFACHIVGLATWSTPEKAYALAVVQLGTITVLCTGASAVTGDLQAPPTGAVWGALLFLALAATALAFVVQTWAQAHMTATRAAVVLLMEPVFAALTSALVGDTLTVRMLVGGALVLAAVAISESGPGQRDAAKSLPHLEP